MTTFSHANLAPLRKAKGMSQQQLAEILGAHLVTVSKLETGKAPLTANWLIRFAEALEVRPADIDAGFWEKGTIRVRKIIRQDGTVQSPQSDLFVELEDAEVWAESVEWIFIESDSLYPVYRNGDLLKVAYEKGTDYSSGWSFLDQICVITISGTYRKAFEIVATPVHIYEDKIDVIHMNGRIERGLVFYRIGLVMCVYPRGGRVISGTALT